MRSFCTGRIEILPFLRRENGIKCGVLYELWKAAAAGSQILSGVRDSGFQMRRPAGSGSHIRKIGDYTVVSCIGKGRYGVCFLALDPKGRKAVLKKFRPHMWKKNQSANHYEAVILSGLSHPAVPELLGVINNRKGYYFVLEYKDGSTLENILFRQKKVLREADIFRIGLQLFEVLEYLHSRNVVHGDISIANIIDNGSRISLLDFGLARYADGENMRFSLDYARAANVLLYLLYSRYPGNGRKPWHEELPLSDQQKNFLKNLFERKETFADTREVTTGFRECFAQYQCGSADCAD